MSATLTPRQARFVEEYLVDLNGTQAAIRAGYSEKGATVQAATLLAIPKVADAVAIAQADRSSRTGITADRVLRELALVGFSDLRHFQLDEKTGKLILADGAPDDAWRAVSSVDYKVTSRPDGSQECEAKIRLWSKTEALTLAGKHLKMYTDKTESSDTLRIVITQEDLDL